MASKIHTDDPKHHSYVCVNKRERKKVKRLGAKRPLLTFLAKEILYHIMHMSCGWGRSAYSYTPKGTIIVWDDCNHKTCRKLVKVQKSFRFVMDRHRGVKHFKRPYSYEY